MKMKTLKLTDNIDMAFYTKDEQYYIIHSGENEGVVFAILDFIATFEKARNDFKYDYKPIILRNEFNARLESIYSEIQGCLEAKLKLAQKESGL